MENDLMDKGFATKIIHCGHEPDPATGAMASPIYQTATFATNTIEDFQELCKNGGYIYSRESNPTTSELEKKLALIEEGESALVTSSGMGAIASVLFTLLRAGDHVICSTNIFSHSKLFMEEGLCKFGVEVTFVDTMNPQNIHNTMKSNTKLVYIETPLNPSLDLVDVKAISEIAHEKNIFVMVDSTFAPPPIQQVLKLGADICVHSLTKYINGHGDALGGAIIGTKEIIDQVRWPGMPCFTGSSLSPFNAWLILRGMSTLEMRMRTHCFNALEIANFLNRHSYVERVNYPALESHPQYDLCQSQMNGMGGGVVSFTFKDGIGGLTQVEAAEKFINHLQICTIATSLGEQHTLVQINDDRIVRLAVGLETASDLVHDVRQALGKI